jgi:hypothetical protein
MNIWHNISPKRIKKDRFYAVIEISKGGKNKYELDKETGMLKLDRVLFTSTHYPANYGFIPRTYASDNDPLDVLVLCSEQIQPMTIVECVPIGVLIMEDGVIYEQIKFCEYWGYERALASHIMTNEYGIPSVTVDRQYTASASGQLRTRALASFHIMKNYLPKKRSPVIFKFNYFSARK